MICQFPMEECNLKIYDERIMAFRCKGNLNCTRGILKEGKLDKKQMELDV